MIHLQPSGALGNQSSNGLSHSIYHTIAIYKVQLGIDDVLGDLGCNGLHSSIGHRITMSEAQVLSNALGDLSRNSLIHEPGAIVHPLKFICKQATFWETWAMIS